MSTHFVVDIGSNRVGEWKHLRSHRFERLEQRVVLLFLYVQNSQSMKTTMMMTAATRSQQTGLLEQWLQSRNGWFSKLCCEEVKNWEVVVAHAVLLFPIMTLVGIGGAL